MFVRDDAATFLHQYQRFHGFTLIEVLVVLALVAGLMAIAFPELVTLYTRVRVSYERSDIEHQLRELPQQVREKGRDGVLRDPTLNAVGHSRKEAAQSDVLTLHIDLPKGWQMRVPKPIYYHFTGACDGGDVIFDLPPLSLHYRLTAPVCRPRIVHAAIP